MFKVVNYNNMYEYQKQKAMTLSKAIIIFLPKMCDSTFPLGGWGTGVKTDSLVSRTFPVSRTSFGN